MSTSSIKAGSAFVEISIRNKMTSGLKSAAGQLKAFASGVQSIGEGLTQVGATIGGIGAAIVGPLAGAAKHFADTGSAIADMSARTGVATDHLSELVYAAEQGGASAADLEAALKRMAKNGLNPEQFDSVAASIANIEDPVERIAAAIEMWGKGGAKLLPVIDSLQSLRGEARNLGLSIDPKAAERADALGDAMDRLLKVGKDLIFEVGNAIAEPLIRFVDTATSLGAALASWVQQNQAVVVTVGAIGLVALTAGAAITALGLTVLSVAAAIGGLATGLTALATSTGIAVASIALVAGGIATVAAGWVLFTESGRYASESFLAMIGGIANAIAQGNILNAWGQLGTGMVIVWAEVVKKIKAAFFQVAQEITAVFGMMLNDIAAAMKMIPGVGKIAAKGLSKAASEINRGLGKYANYSLGESDNTIATLQAQLDVLRGMVSGGMNSALPQLPKLASILEGITSGGNGPGSLLGGAQGTFNASAAALLGRSGGPMDRTAKEAVKQTSLLEKIKEVLGDIDEGIEDLEGFSFQ